MVASCIGYHGVRYSAVTFHRRSSQFHRKQGGTPARDEQKPAALVIVHVMIVRQRRVIIDKDGLGEAIFSRPENPNLHPADENLSVDPSEQHSLAGDH